MKSIIILNSQGGYFSFPHQPHLTVVRVDDEREAYLYNIEHPEVVAYHIDSADYSLSQLQELVDNIHFLNPLISIIIKAHEDTDLSSIKDYGGIRFYYIKQDLDSIINELPINQRRSHRVKWPIKAQFWKKNKPLHTHSGLVLSLSQNGCFIQTSYPLESDETVMTTIRFKEFNFLAEGRVIRIHNKTDTKGIALEFVEISDQTSAFIEKLINERILSKIMDTIGDAEEADL